MEYKCKTCCNTKTVKVRYSDCGGYMHGQCPPSHAGVFVRCPDCTQEKALPIDGEGYLKEAPIPVITDWRKAP
jgi:hypothetical protein